MKEKLIKIEEQAQIFCQARDCYVYAVEFARGSKTLRIYIDKDAGVDIEDCSEVSRQISNWLDEQDIMETNYDLEVSSPGLERPLLKAWHYDKAVGQVVAIKLYDRLGSIISVKENLAKAKNIKAKLINFKEDNIQLNIEGEDYVLPMDKVAKANIVFEMN